eukprot:4698495-Amphidinium_carterae.1
MAWPTMDMDLRTKKIKRWREWPASDEPMTKPSSDTRRKESQPHFFKSFLDGARLQNTGGCYYGKSS